MLKTIIYSDSLADMVSFLKDRLQSFDPFLIAVPAAAYTCLLICRGTAVPSDPI
jgi:hypothetical protein